MEREKKTYLRFWTNSVKLLGHYRRLPRKNLSSLGEGVGELEVLKGHIFWKKSVFFLFFSGSQNCLRFIEQHWKGAIWVSAPLWTTPILFGSKLIPLSRGQKVADRKNRVFIFQKIQLKDLLPQICTQKIFLAQRSGFRLK